MPSADTVNMSPSGDRDSVAPEQSVAPPGLLTLVPPLDDQDTASAEAPAAPAGAAPAVVRRLEKTPLSRRSKRIVAPGQVRSPQELIEMGEIATDSRVVAFRASGTAEEPYRFPGCAHPADMLALLDAAAAAPRAA